MGLHWTVRTRSVVAELAGETGTVRRWSDDKSFIISRDGLVLNFYTHRMGEILIVVVAALAVVALLSFLQTRPDREARARIREEQEFWQSVEKNLAVPCPRMNEGLPCQGMAVPIRESMNQYRCPVCGGEFHGKLHGW